MELSLVRYLVRCHVLTHAADLVADEEVVLLVLEQVHRNARSLLRNRLLGLCV